MSPTPDKTDLDFTHVFDGPLVKPTPLAESSKEQKKAVEVGTAELEKAGYYVNIVRPASGVAPLAPGAKRTILCIDDDVPLLRILERKLTMDGYVVRTASERSAIIAELQRAPSPDLILLDVGLPGISGFDVLRKVRKHPKLGNLPVIMLTGHVAPDDVHQGMTCGADGYVSKPFQFDTLAVAIKTVLGMQ